MAATIKIALVSRTIFYAPVWMAEQNGYFRDEGIDARFEIFDNAEKINEVMRAGTAQIAIASVEALVADAFKGGKFRIVASVAQKPPHFIIAQPRFKTVMDLRGARFGVLSLHKGTTYFVQDLEKAIGFKRGDIVIDAVGGAPTRWKLLREGKIDAGLQPFPLSYESEAAGFSNLGPIATYVPDYEFTALFLDPAWGDANRPAVTGFLRALRRGQAARPPTGQGRRDPGERAWHHPGLCAPGDRRCAQVQADARRPRRLRTWHAARFHHAAARGARTQRPAVRDRPLRRSELSRRSAPSVTRARIICVLPVRAFALASASPPPGSQVPARRRGQPACGQSGPTRARERAYIR